MQQQRIIVTYDLLGLVILEFAEVEILDKVWKKARARTGRASKAVSSPNLIASSTAAHTLLNDGRGCKSPAASGGCSLALGGRIRTGKERRRISMDGAVRSWRQLCAHAGDKSGSSSEHFMKQDLVESEPSSSGRGHLSSQLCAKACIFLDTSDVAQVHNHARCSILRTRSRCSRCPGRWLLHDGFRKVRPLDRTAWLQPIAAKPFYNVQRVRQ